MGLLMLAGLLGTIGYMGYYAKQEATAIIGDSVIKPTDTLYEDKIVIARNFKLICKRGNAKLDKEGNPVNKTCNQCLAYLQYQGFQQFAVDYFEQLYLDKYNKGREQARKKLQDKYWMFEQQFYDEYDKRETKIIRHWDFGNTQEKCEKMMKNWLWMHMVTHYNIVDDGISNVEVWTISAPPSILRQIDTIYDMVCEMEVYSKEE